MKSPSIQILLLHAVLLCLPRGEASAQAIAPVFQDDTQQPGDTTLDYQFSGFSIENYPAYPSFEGSNGGLGPWPASIQANGGLLAESLNRPDPTQYTDFLSAASDGGGMYSFFTETAFSINQAAPLSHLSSLRLQIYEAAGSDSGAVNNEYVGLPTLTLTLADSTVDVITASSAIIANSTPVTIFGQTTTLDDLSFDFDTSDVAGLVASYTLNWATATHSVTYGADVTEASPQAVPEPSAVVMLIAAGLGGLLYHGRQRVQNV